MSESFQRKVLLLFCSLFAGSMSAEAAEIRFKSDARVAGSLVKLGDVAEVRDMNAAQAAALQALDLFPAPSRTRPRLVRTIDIRQLLRLHDIDLAKHRFTGSSIVRVTSQAVVESESVPVASSPTNAPTSAISVVITTRTIAAGETIRGDDLELVASADATPAPTTLRSIDSVIGQETTRAIAAGQPVDSRFLKRPLVVQKGQSIAVIARAAGVQARTTARALENGAQGDQITVESIDTKEKYSVVVTGRQQAEVLVKSAAQPMPSLAAPAAVLAERPAVTTEGVMK